MTNPKLLLPVLVLVLLWAATSAFSTADQRRSSPVVPRSSRDDGGDRATTPISVESVIQTRYPEFHRLLSKNENLFDQLANDFVEQGYTLFIPTSAAFDELGGKKRSQLEDPRNLETAQKMGLYHVVDEPLSITDLNREDWTVPKTPDGLPALKFGAIQTRGGEVPIGRTKKQADGNLLQSLLGRGGPIELDETGKPKIVVIVGPAGKILRSLKIGNAVIHEVDSLVSPTILWRYCDQLRIPGF